MLYSYAFLTLANEIITAYYVGGIADFSILYFCTQQHAIWRFMVK